MEVKNVIGERGAVMKFIFVILAFIGVVLLAVTMPFDFTSTQKTWLFLCIVPFLLLIFYVALRD